MGNFAVSYEGMCLSERIYKRNPVRAFHRGIGMVTVLAVLEHSRIYILSVLSNRRRGYVAFARLGWGSLKATATWKSRKGHAVVTGDPRS